MRVLDRHRGIVDQDADRECKPAERHRVQGLAETIQHDQRRQHRQRDRDQDDQRRSPRSQKQQDHQRREARRDRALAQHAIDRMGDEDRLVEQLVDLQPCRSRRANRTQGLLHPVDDGERRGISVLDHAEQDGAMTVLAHDVLLDLGAVPDLGHVLQEDRGPVHELDRDHVEILDRGRRGVGSNGVLGVADFRRPGGQRQILGVHRIDDVERRQSARQELVRIDVDHDLAVLAAGRRGQRHARNRRQLLPDTVDTEIV